MNRWQRAMLSASVAAGAAALLTCASLNDVASGSSSETVVGRICHAGGAPAADTRVTLYPAGYDPFAAAPLPASSTDTTDDSGAYAIPVPDSAASYTLEAVHLSLLTRALVAGITISGDTTVVPEAALAAPGALRLMLPDSVDYVNGYVFIPGTGISAGLAGSSGSVMLDTVPAGTAPAVCYATTYSPVPAVIRYDVPVVSGDTVTVSHPSWKHARRIRLNTAPSGAGVAGDVAAFPVLVRLTDGTFDFAEALADGGDVRFAASDSAFLPHEIERWDPATGRAEMWVLVDTVRGNDSVQSVTLYWGNENAAGSSSGSAVFTAAGGFEGVWHLSGSCSDATAHGHTGTCYGTTATAGVAGPCLRFYGNSYARIPGLLNTQPQVTLSAWARLDTVRLTGAEVISIGDAVLIRMDDSWNNKGTHGAYFDNPAGGVDSTHCVTTLNQFLRGTGWHHLAYSVDIAGGRQSLYIDGSLCCFTANTVPIIYSGIGSDTYIGRHGNGMTSFYFTGAIDEVRVDRAVRSADWIRLCCMNQRSDDRLVELR